MSQHNGYGWYAVQGEGGSFETSEGVDFAMSE